MPDNEIQKPSKQMDFSSQQECKGTIKRIRELIGCKIFESNNSKHILYNSAFIELMICLRDLLEKAQIYAHRLTFTDDVIPSEYVRDIHGLVKAMRDGCCHIDSYTKPLGKPQHRGSFNVMYGKGSLAKINDVELKSDYTDDIAFFHGTNRIYLKRHIIRAFEEAVTLLDPMIENEPFSEPL